MITAYHWLEADMTAGSGNEPPWQVGEERTMEGELTLRERGYHSSSTLYDSLRYAPGPVARRSSRQSNALRRRRSLGSGMPSSSSSN